MFEFGSLLFWCVVAPTVLAAPDTRWARMMELTQRRSVDREILISPRPEPRQQKREETRPPESPPSPFPLRRQSAGDQPEGMLGTLPFHFDHVPQRGIQDLLYREGQPSNHRKMGLPLAKPTSKPATGIPYPWQRQPIPPSSGRKLPNPSILPDQ